MDQKGNTEGSDDEGFDKEGLVLSEFCKVMSKKTL